MFKRFERVVRCSDGHLFQTIWVPLASLKAVRLISRRFQYCPVGHHWAMVERVDEQTLSPDVLAAARTAHDIPIP